MATANGTLDLKHMEQQTIGGGGGPERAVLTFLRKRGYKMAEEALAREAGIERGDESIATVATEGQIRDRAQFFASSDGDPQAWVRAYAAVSEFVDGALEAFRPELRRVLFPIFAHFIVELAKSGCAEEAGELARRYGPEHERLHGEEVAELTKLRSPEHVANSDLAQAILSSRAQVRLSRPSFDLLIRFLQRTDNTLALSSLNERVDVHVSGTDPEPIEEEPENPNDPSSRLGYPVQPCSGPAGPWGVLSQDPEYRAAEGMPPDAVPQGQFNTVEARVPVPQMGRDEDAQAVEDARKQARLSKDSLPSTCFFTFTHASGRLAAADTSPCARRVAGAFSDGCVRLWDMATGQHSRLAGHAGPCFSVGFSQCGNHLVSGGYDGSVRLWHTGERMALAAYYGHRHPVWSVAFSPFGYFFATGSYDRTCRVYASDQAHAVRVLAGHISDVDAVSWHPSCNYIATGSCDKTVRLWDVHSGESVRLFVGPLSRFTCVAFSPDGSEVAAGAEDGSVSVWDLASAKRRLHLKQHSRAVWSIAFSREGALLASASEDASLCLWDASSTASQCLLRQHQAKTSILSVSFTRRNLCLCCGSF